MIKYECSFCGGYEEDAPKPEGEGLFVNNDGAVCSLFTVEQGKTKYSICVKCVKKIIEKLLT